MLVLFRYIKESQILRGVSSVAELSFITSFTSRAGAANILTVLWIFCIFNENTFSPNNFAKTETICVSPFLRNLPTCCGKHKRVRGYRHWCGAYFPGKTRSAQVNVLNASQFSWCTCRTACRRWSATKMVRSPQHQPGLLRYGRCFMRVNCQKLHI